MPVARKRDVIIISPTARPSVRGVDEGDSFTAHASPALGLQASLRRAAAHGAVADTTNAGPAFSLRRRLAIMLGSSLALWSLPLLIIIAFRA